MATTQPIIFDDTTNNQGICQDIDFICGTNLTSFPKLDKVRLVNLGLDSVADLIQKVSDNYSWDDSGQTDLPIEYFDTVDGQMDYDIDTSFIGIKGVYINTGSETYVEADQVDKKTIMENTTEGTATGFHLDGNSIYLYPIPDSTTTGNSTTLLGYGFKVQVERQIIYFASDATSVVVGYNPQFTRLATYYACRDYAMAKGLANLNSILFQIDKMEKALQGSYARRNKTQKKRLIPNVEDNR